VIPQTSVDLRVTHWHQFKRSHLVVRVDVKGILTMRLNLPVLGQNETTGGEYRIEVGTGLARMVIML